MTAQSPDTFTQRLLDARAHDPAGLKELAEDHLPLVAALVKRFPHGDREPEELYQQGCVGLMKALGRYDPAFGTTFSTYAAAMILGEMRMLCRMDTPVHLPRPEREKRSRVHHARQLLTSRLGREPTIDELAAVLRMPASELVLAMEGLHVHSLDEKPDGLRALGEMLPDKDAWMDRLLLRDIIARMPEDDRRILLLRFRLGLTQRETAHRMNMTQVQVSRREAAIRARLRAAWNEVGTS